jgi:hypothetical protein
MILVRTDHPCLRVGRHKALHDRGWLSSHPYQCDMTHIRQGYWTALCSQTRCGSLARDPRTLWACCGADPQISDEHGRLFGTHPMGFDDQQVGQLCRRPTKLQLTLVVVGPHTEFSGTPYSAAAQTWTLSCGASCPPLGDRSHQWRLAGELLGDPSIMDPGLGVEVAGVQPHDASHSP